jgi:hypothetical protein
MGEPADRRVGAPRQGWLNTFDGVFYRLVIGTYGYAHANKNVETNTGTFTAYLPLNQRFELRPIYRASPGRLPWAPVTTSSDPLHAPRDEGHVALDERPASKTPTGDTDIGNGVASIIPQYEF